MSRREWCIEGWLVAAFLALAGVVPAQACGRDVPCVLADGTYRVARPSHWDSASALPVALFFHGYRQSASDVMRNEVLVEAFSRAGILLVALDGLSGTWTFPGSPSQMRDDVAFALAVLDDVGRRFPVAERLIWATGFSQGGSMVWWLACRGGERFAAFVPVAGAFWEPIPTECPAGAANIMHVHGEADGTVPMAGRSLGGGRFRQGDVKKGLAVWRRVDRCRSEQPDSVTKAGPFVCRAWRACASGRELRLCLHGAGHEYDAAWVSSAWSFVRETAERSPSSGLPMR